jgi:hypothetical protein
MRDFIQNLSKFYFNLMLLYFIEITDNVERLFWYIFFQIFNQS